jgi:DNA repair exonuclease SbcCD ATPase subunit
MLNTFIGFNPLRSEDAGLDGGYAEAVETGEEEMETAAPSDEEGVEEQETAEPAEEESKSDAAFARMRRELEEAQRRAEELEMQVQEYDDALGQWFEGDDKIAQAYAHYEDIPLDEAISNIEQRREINQLKAEKALLEEQRNQLEFNNLKAEDLKEIKSKYADAGIKDVEELGEDFFKYRTMGIDPVTAYEAIQMKKGQPPKSMGKARTGTPTKTGYFTREEVQAMSPSQISKNFDKIRESMSKWK